MTPLAEQTAVQEEVPYDHTAKLVAVATSKARHATGLSTKIRPIGNVSGGTF